MSVLLLLSTVEDGTPVFDFSLASLDEIFRTEQRHVTRLEFCKSSSVSRLTGRQVRRFQRGLDTKRAIGTSIRAYKNANRYPWQPSHDRKPAVEAPAGFTFLTGDAFPPGATVENRVDLFKMVYAKAHESGGHFGPWENPDAFIEGIRETFRILKRA